MCKVCAGRDIANGRVVGGLEHMGLGERNESRAMAWRPEWHVERIRGCSCESRVGYPRGPYPHSKQISWHANVREFTHRLI